jgi:hypothetical protein
MICKLLVANVSTILRPMTSLDPGAVISLDLNPKTYQITRLSAQLAWIVHIFR